MAICAKCRLTADESEARAMDAIRKGGNFDAEDAEYYANLAEKKKNGDDDDTDDSDEEEEEEEQEEPTEADREKSEKQLEKEADKKKRDAELEADHPILIRLRGLDTSLIRYELEEERKNLALSKIKAGGKLKERDRRTAFRMLARGDERAAVELAEKRGKRDDDDDNNLVEGEDEEEEEVEEVPVKKMNKDSKIDLSKMVNKNGDEQQQQPAKLLKLAQAAQKAGETDSDEETL